MSDNRLHRLPSVDWLAFGVALAAATLAYRWPWLGVLTVPAVFLPSVLRETGILRDADEYTRDVARRAGFHAVLAAGVLVLVNELMGLAGWYPDSAALAEPVVVGSDTLRMAMIWVFVFSYLLQYWGVQEGMFRILLGLAALHAARSLVLWAALSTSGPMQTAVALVTGGLLAGLGWLARRRPRAAGVLLVAGFVAQVALGVSLRNYADEYLWGWLAVVVQWLLVAGIGGVVLIRSARGSEPCES